MHRDNALEPRGALEQVVGVGAFSPVPARPGVPGQGGKAVSPRPACTVPQAQANGVQAGSLRGLRLVPIK